MGKSGGNSNSATQITDIPEWAQPYSRSLLTAGANAASMPYTQYEGMRVAPLNDAQNAALGLYAGLGGTGSPTTNTGLQSINATLNGDYANPWATTWNPYAMSGNPELEQMIKNTQAGISDNYNKTIAPGTDSLMIMNGAFGGSAWQDKKQQDQKTLAGALSSADTNLRFQDYAQKANLLESALGRGTAAYESERGRQMSAIPLALQGDNIFATRAGYLSKAGDFQRQYTQDLINENISEFNRQQQYPWQQIDQLGAVLGKALGGASQTTSMTNSPYRPAGLAGAIGGAALGYGMSGMLPEGLQSYAPWLGAGLGYFA